MFNHEPEGYVCPFCLVVQGVENKHVGTAQSDVIYRGEMATAFICSAWWPNNEGHVLVVPNRHIENLYDMPPDVSAAVHDLEREVAIALKEVYGCGGTSSRQHNEPEGYQEVWHYHLHVFPRYTGDNLYKTDRRSTTPEERLPYAEKLRRILKEVKVAGDTEAPEPGLCGHCRYVRLIESQRGSVFYFCQQSETDSRFIKYPRLPVTACGGYELDRLEEGE